jgi:uncharacterized protein GlcG (DUF336 family)
MQEVTVVVLDTSGVHEAMIRGDGAGIHAIDTAHHEAYTAMTFKTDTIDLVARSNKVSMPSAINIVPNLLLAQGGVLVRAGDEIIAAIGVSGARAGDMDTQCAGGDRTDPGPAALTVHCHRRHCSALPGFRHLRDAAPEAVPKAPGGIAE